MLLIGKRELDDRNEKGTKLYCGTESRFHPEAFSSGMERLAFFPWNQRERDRCFGCDLAIDGDNALCLPHGLSHDGSLHDEGGFDAHGIAGQDHFAEASAFDACKDRVV